MLSGEEPNGESDPNRQMFNHYATQQAFNQTLFSHQNNAIFSHQTRFHNPNQAEAQPQPDAHHSRYDQRAYSGVLAFSKPHPSLLSLDPLSGAGGSGGGYFLVLKSEEVSTPVDFTARIGLNLGGRTYLSSVEDGFVNRLYRRSRPGDISSITTPSPRCQAEGRNVNLTLAKHYHRRHKV